MEIRKFFTAVLCLLAVLLWLPSLVWAGVEIPYRSIWYLDADLQQMRNTEAGSKLYKRFDREVLSEIRKELGIDVNKEVNRVTAFATEADGPVAIVTGKISEDSQNKLLAIAATAEKFEILNAGGKTFYYVWQPKMRDNEAFNKGLYFSFDLKDRLVLAANRDSMETLLANNGTLTEQKTDSEALFRLMAQQGLIQGGLQVDEVDGAGAWNSNVLNNTEQIAFMIANATDKLALDAQITAREPGMAQSLANIVRGLISLQVFSSDLDPQLTALLQSVKIDVEGGILKVSATVDPDTIPE